MKKKSQNNAKRKSTEYRYLQIGKVGSDFERCIICESMDDSPPKEASSHNCILFGGEPICMHCCIFEVDCGRGEQKLIDAICGYMNIADTDIYSRCMKCPYSNKNNIYTFLLADIYKICYFVTILDKDRKPDEEITMAMIKKKGFCTLFNRKCKHRGNVMECEHGALNNSSLMYMQYMIEKELMLRGVPIEIEYYDNDDNDDDFDEEE